MTGSTREERSHPIARTHVCLGRRWFLGLCAAICILVTIGSAKHVLAQSSGSVVAWGKNNYGQSIVPDSGEDFVAVSGGYNHSLALKSDGSIVAWGDNEDGQCDVSLPNSGFVAVDAGCNHSLGLRSDGSIEAWGENGSGQCDVPEPNSGSVAVTAGGWHGMALRPDSTVVTWGFNYFGQCDVPPPNSGFVAMSGGYYHSMGLRSDGTISCWGHNGRGQCDVPEPNADFIAISAGGSYSMGLKFDGTAVAWGDNNRGQTNVPAVGPVFAAISAGWQHSLALRTDESVEAWGWNTEGQCDVPQTDADFIAIAAGGEHSLGIKDPETPVETAFYATLVEDGRAVLLRWMLPSCSGGTGLVIYRALSANGPYSCITPDALPDGVLGNYVDETAWPGGTFWYELRAVLASGEEILVTETRPSATVPGTLVSEIRYVMPNPAATHTSIAYSLPEGWRSARLSVHDVAGRLVRRLDPATGTQGLVAVDWDGRAGSGKQVASGVYFVRLDVDGAVSTHRMVLLH